MVFIYERNCTAYEFSQLDCRAFSRDAGRNNDKIVVHLLFDVFCISPADIRDIRFHFLIYLIQCLFRQHRLAARLQYKWSRYHVDGLDLDAGLFFNDLAK